MSKVKDTFTGIADIYDRMNHMLSLGLDRRWRRIAIRMADMARSPSAPDGRARSPSAPTLNVLDLACGTGDMSLELANAFTDAEITGLDFTPAMLDVARVKCREEKRITFLEGDAMSLPFASASDIVAARSAIAIYHPARSAIAPYHASCRRGDFNLVTCAWGFRNFPDKKKALSECSRVLVTNGRLVVLEFFRPEHKALGWLTALWLRILSPVLAPGRRNAYAYLRESMRATVTAEEFISMASECGFDLKSRRFLLPACTCLVLEKH